ncbi:MAG: hypothetical protein KDI56_09485 [Xanthomonadales bacterium]|nr:hypothetical protein [Xanthomonadales bacterium]MCB1636415.1 hypothetical protein [Xanthomonadales bacterium]
MSKSPQSRKIWKKIDKLEFQIEERFSDSPGEGFIANMYGDFDRADLTEKLFALYDEMLELEPEDFYIVYRHAGSLMRACRFDDARAQYLRCAPGDRAAELMLAMLEVNFGSESEAERWIASYNDRCEREGMELMKSNLEKLKISSGRG